MLLLSIGCMQKFQVGILILRQSQVMSQDANTALSLAYDVLKLYLSQS